MWNAEILKKNFVPREIPFDVESVVIKEHYFHPFLLVFQYKFGYRLPIPNAGAYFQANASFSISQEYVMEQQLKNEDIGIDAIEEFYDERIKHRVMDWLREEMMWDM